MSTSPKILHWQDKRTCPISQPLSFNNFGLRSRYARSSVPMGERFSRLESMLYFSKRPSSIKIIHFPHVAFSAQMDSISTPSSRAAVRTDVPSSTWPRRPDGCRMMLCFWPISSMAHAGSACLHGAFTHDSHFAWEFLFWQTQFPVPKEAFQQLLRGSHRVRSSHRVCIAHCIGLNRLIQLQSRKHQSHFEFF